MKATSEELERRRPVWEAMSAFFLDTELETHHHEQIAKVLLSSGYSNEELDAILWQELCPVLGCNLASIAGEWAGFDMNYVEDQILNHPAGAFRRWRSKVEGGWIAGVDWSKVLAILNSSRAE